MTIQMVAEREKKVWVLAGPVCNLSVARVALHFFSSFYVQTCCIYTSFDVYPTTSEIHDLIRVSIRFPAFLHPCFHLVKVLDDLHCFGAFSEDGVEGPPCRFLRVF